MKLAIIISFVLGFSLGLGAGIMYCGANPVIRYVDRITDDGCDYDCPQKGSEGIVLYEEKECPPCRCPKQQNQNCVWTTSPGCKVE